MGKRDLALLVASWVIFLPLLPLCVAGLVLCKLGYFIADRVQELEAIDPMPWNQAFLLGTALAVLFFMAVICPN